VAAIWDEAGRLSAASPKHRTEGGRVVLYIIGLIVGGLIVGLLARLLHPGRDSMSIWMTIALGALSMLIAGLVVKPLIGIGGGIITAIIVAVILLAIYGRLTRHDTSRRGFATR
jgi:uncharacterized membrane protein YeaQ/YmgE (transglycosylase-associated protein family)